MNTQFKLIFTTCKNEAEARMLGKALVEKKLAACVNIFLECGIRHLRGEGICEKGV